MRRPPPSHPRLAGPTRARLRASVNRPRPGGRPPHNIPASAAGVWFGATHAALLPRLRCAARRRHWRGRQATRALGGELTNFPATCAGRRHRAMKPLASQRRGGGGGEWQGGGDKPRHVAGGETAAEAGADVIGSAARPPGRRRTSSVWRGPAAAVADTHTDSALPPPPPNPAPIGHATASGSLSRPAQGALCSLQTRTRLALSAAWRRRAPRAPVRGRPTAAGPAAHVTAWLSN